MAKCSTLLVPEVGAGRTVQGWPRAQAVKLRTLGWSFDRHAAGSHEIWRHAATGRKVTVPHHARDMPEGTLRAILREAGIETEAFLRA